jgi:hypothetical protein
MGYSMCIGGESLHHPLPAMTTSKEVILTAIHFKGTKEAKKIASQLADDLMISRGYVLSVIRQVEKQAIIIQSA